MRCSTRARNNKLLEAASGPTLSTGDAIVEEKVGEAWEHGDGGYCDRVQCAADGPATRHLRP